MTNSRTDTDTATAQIRLDQDALDETTRAPRPRVRAGAIAWGLIVCGIAGVVLAVNSSAANRAAYTEWAGSLTGGGIALGVVLALGGLALLLGLLAVIRRAQRG